MLSTAELRLKSQHTKHKIERKRLIRQLFFWTKFSFQKFANYKLSANFLMISQFSTEAASFSLFVQDQNEDGVTRCSCTEDSLKAISKNVEKVAVTTCPMWQLAPLCLITIYNAKTIIYHFLHYWLLTKTGAKQFFKEIPRFWSKCLWSCMWLVA